MKTTTSVHLASYSAADVSISLATANNSGKKLTGSPVSPIGPAGHCSEHDSGSGLMLLMGGISLQVSLAARYGSQWITSHWRSICIENCMNSDCTEVMTSPQLESDLG